MNEKLQQYADQIIEALESGVSFVGEQAPVFIQEVLSYYTVLYSVGLVISVIIFTLCCVYLRKVYRMESREISDGKAFLAVFSGVFGIGSFMFTVASGLAVVKITIAPRLFLIEKLAELLS